MNNKEFNKEKIKAIAVDLDGTLLRPDKTLSGRTIRAVNACTDRGIAFIIATGRSVDSGEIYRKQLGIAGPQVYYNGAEVADTEAGKMIHTEYLAPPPVLFCVRLARKMGLYYQVYFPAGFAGPGEILMADHLQAEAELYAKSTGIQAVAGDLEEYLSAPNHPGVIKSMFITTEENQKKIRPLLEEEFGDSVYVVRSSPEFLETLSPKASKAAGLGHALNYLGLKPEESLAFGDEENDISMLNFAGFSAAPANALQAVREAARFHIPSNGDDGVAAFLEEHLV